jgi:hypothetical protein
VSVREREGEKEGEKEGERERGREGGGREGRREGDESRPVMKAKPVQRLPKLNAIEDQSDSSASRPAT